MEIEAQKLSESGDPGKAMPNGTSDEELDADQQKAYETILSKIQEGVTETAESEAASINPERDDQEHTDDCSAELEMVVPVVNAGSGSIVEEEENEGGMEAEGDGPQDSIALEEPSPDDPPPAHTATVFATSDPAVKRDQTLTVPPKKRSPSQKKGWRTVFAIVTAIVVFCVPGGWFLWWSESERGFDPPTVPVTDFSRENMQTQAVPGGEKLGAVSSGHDDVLRLQAMIQSINRLREETIEKQREIEDLCQYYKDGMEAEIQGIVDVVQASERKEVTFASALENTRIRLGLNAIQRRNATIQKLETPGHRLFLNGEELLFYIRRATALTAMAGKTGDIDIDGFLGNATDVCERLQSDLTSLTIGEKSVSPISLATIWQDVARRVQQNAVDSARRKQGTSTENTGGWKDFCAGNFSELDRLTALSPEAARCLAKWKGKDLYLNGLTRLSPEAAYYLSAWKGEWLGLNGLTELTPKTASYLATWKGSVLSLNGVSHLSPAVVDILSGWQGDQIELISVEHSVQWKNPETRLYLSEDVHRRQFAKRE